MVTGALRALDQSLEEAAQGLGSSPWRVFWTVTVPVTLPSILGGALLVFLTAFAEFGAPMIIGEGYQVLPTIVYSLFVNEMGGNPAMASTAATLLVLCTTGILLIQYWAVGRRRYAMSQLRPIPPFASAPSCSGSVSSYVYLVVGLSLIPAVVVAVTSFFESRGPVLYPNFSLGNYREVLFNVPRAIANSFMLSTVSTLLDVLLGTLIAYLVVRRRSATTAALDSCVMVPYAIPGTVIGVAFIVAFNKPPIVLTGTFLILLVGLLHPASAVLGAGGVRHPPPDRPGGGGGLDQPGRLAAQELRQGHGPPDDARDRLGRDPDLGADHHGDQRHHLSLLRRLVHDHRRHLSAGQQQQLRQRRRGVHPPAGGGLHPGPGGELGDG